MHPRLESLVRRALRELEEEELVVLAYFLENISVGDLRAQLELMERGVSDPNAVIARLVDRGYLERGREAINLARELRELLALEGGDLLETGSRVASRIHELLKPAPVSKGVGLSECV